MCELSVETSRLVMKDNGMRIISDDAKRIAVF